MKQQTGVSCGTPRFSLCGRFRGGGTCRFASQNTQKFTWIFVQAYKAY